MSAENILTFDLPQFTLGQIPNLSDGEQVALAKLLNEPLVKKYLQILIYNTIKDGIEIPLNTLAGDGLVVNAIKQAYIKGRLSSLYDLNSVEKPQPSVVQANQAQPRR